MVIVDTSSLSIGSKEIYIHFLPVSIGGHDVAAVLPLSQGMCR